MFEVFEVFEFFDVFGVFDVFEAPRLFGFFWGGSCSSWVVVSGLGGLGWLFLVLGRCFWSWVVVSGLGWLVLVWVVLGGCFWSWVVVSGIGWLFLVLGSCRCLCNTGRLTKKRGDTL